MQMTEDAARTRTLLALHILGEHVLAAARYAATGRIGLTVTDGNIATPPYGSDERTLAIVGTELVRTDRTGVRRAPITTLRAAGELAEVTPGAPADVYKPATPCDLDAPLELDPTSLKELTDWYALSAEALARFTADLAGDDGPAPITLWPEHFDIATRIGEVNYGGLGGDDTVPLPYLYVGPTGTTPRSGPPEFWNVSFGAARDSRQITGVEAALAFFLEGYRYGG
jgi:hypothetical protein